MKNRFGPCSGGRKQKRGKDFIFILLPTERLRPTLSFYMLNLTMPLTSSNPILSVVLPCLNEEQSLAVCLREIKQTADKMHIPYEIIVADNRSTDGSAQVARSFGARVVPVARRGYGAAVNGGILAARGEVVLFGDADCSYPFYDIPKLVTPILQGKQDFVLGNRLNNTQEKGSMPWMNRYFGTPVLSALIRWFYGIAVYDCNGGMRAFLRKIYAPLGLKQPGMEYASEMLIAAAKQNLRYLEVPIALRRAHPSHTPYLRPWRDGMRHLYIILKSLFAR